VFEYRDIVTTNRNAFRIQVAKSVGLLSIAYCLLPTARRTLGSCVLSHTRSIIVPYVYVLTTHDAHKRQISMSPARFEPAIPASERPQAYALDGADTRAGSMYHTAEKNRRPLSTSVCSVIAGSGWIGR
jgi:hypothetical protein